MYIIVSAVKVRITFTQSEFDCCRNVKETFNAKNIVLPVETVDRQTDVYMDKSKYNIRWTIYKMW